MGTVDFSTRNHFERRIGRRVTTDAVPVRWKVVQGPRWFRRTPTVREVSGRIVDVSITGVGVLGPRDLSLEPGRKVLLRVRARDNVVVVRHSRPVGDGTIQLYGVELTRHSAGLKQLVQDLLSEEAPTSAAMLERYGPELGFPALDHAEPLPSPGPSRPPTPSPAPDEPAAALTEDPGNPAAPGEAEAATSGAEARRTGREGDASDRHAVPVVVIDLREQTGATPEPTGATSPPPTVSTPGASSATEPDRPGPSRNSVSAPSPIDLEWLAPLATEPVPSRAEVDAAGQEEQDQEGRERQEDEPGSTSPDVDEKAAAAPRTRPSAGRQILDEVFGLMSD